MLTPDYIDNYDIHSQASRYGMIVNEGRCEKIIKALEVNETKYGAPYCPCLNGHNEDTICPCKHMRVHKACRCGLYLRQEVTE